MRIADAPDVLRAHQVAELLDTDVRTVYTEVREGRLHAVRLGRSIRVPKASLLAFLGVEGSPGPNGHPPTINGQQ